MTGQSSKLFGVAVALLLLAGACTAPATPVPTPGPLDVVKVFQDTFNNRDLDGFLALFADNPSWDVLLVVSGKKAVRNVIEFEVEYGTQWAISDCQLSDTTVTCKALVTDHCMPPEVTAYHWDMQFDFVDGKISRVSGQINPEELGAFYKYDAQRTTWGQANLLDDYAHYSQADWEQFSGTGEQAGYYSAVEFGKFVERVCTGYRDATR